MNANGFCVAIERGERSQSYVKAAKELNIPYLLIDGYDSDLIAELKECQAFCWHWSQSFYQDKRIAKEILYAVSQMGISVYPDMNTCMTFDDKVAQKYLLEALDAPLVPSMVFYDANRAKKYLKTANYPLVCKLAGGAGSKNVSLLKDYGQAIQVCNRRFNSHITLADIVGHKKGIKPKLKYFIQDDNARFTGLDKGYLYLQEFMPDNQYDIRVTIIGNRAIIFRRFVRENDFRASGSGKISYEVSEQDKKAIPIAFLVAGKLKAQTCAFDFVYNRQKELRIVEMSYGFVSKAVSGAEGYYDSMLVYHKEITVAEQEVIKLLYNTYKKNSRE